MKKVLIKIKDNTLVFKERIKLNNDYKSIINTNTISANELVFSEEYLINNKHIVSTFLEELIKNFGIDTIIIEKNYFTLIILDLIKDNKYINNLILKEEDPLTFKMCEAIIKTNIKNINCYNLQPFMIEYLDKYGCLVESRNEILFLSKFMILNNLSVASSLFYKVTLQVDLPMNMQDEEDFIAFCKINKYLKTINVNKVQKSDLEFIIDTLRKTNKKNIRIVIHENIDNPEVIEYLREYNKRKSKKSKIYFRLSYSDEYLEENLMKETNSNLLRVCGLMFIILLAFTFGYVFYDNYISMQKDIDIKEKINTVISINDLNTLNAINEQIPENEKKAINQEIANLYNVNPEVVAWLKVNDTNIDYPVVKTINNDYYLNHNFYLESDNNGWIFMDYRNNLNNLSDNIIIYGHNRYYSGIMFGTLPNTLRQSWYENPDNQIITLDTLYETLHYQVFSVYKVYVTTDYLKTLFLDDTARLEFYNMLSERSIHNFDIKLKGSDKILTLQTCANEVERYVLHAVLINEEN